MYATLLFNKPASLQGDPVIPKIHVTVKDRAGDFRPVQEEHSYSGLHYAALRHPDKTAGETRDAIQSYLDGAFKTEIAPAGTGHQIAVETDPMTRAERDLLYSYGYNPVTVAPSFSEKAIICGASLSHGAGPIAQPVLVGKIIHQMVRMYFTSRISIARMMVSKAQVEAEQSGLDHIAAEESFKYNPLSSFRVDVARKLENNAPTAFALYKEPRYGIASVSEKLFDSKAVVIIPWLFDTVLVHTGIQEANALLGLYPKLFMMDKSSIGDHPYDLDVASYAKEQHG